MLSLKVDNMVGNTGESSELPFKRRSRCVWGQVWKGSPPPLTSLKPFNRHSCVWRQAWKGFLPPPLPSPPPPPPLCIQEFEFWGSWQRGTHVQTFFALSLFSRYVLVVQPDVRQSQVEATTLEETLLFLRFPKSRVRRRHTSATIPRTVSNRSFHVETSFEMWLDSSLSVKMQFLSGISREFYNWYLSYMLCWDRSEVKVDECKNKFYVYLCI